MSFSSGEGLQYNDFLLHLPVGVGSKELIALKGHLLIELALRDYIYKRVENPDGLKCRPIPFAYLTDFAESLDNDVGIDWVWGALRKANTLRNRLAHQLHPKDFLKLEEDIISLVESHDGKAVLEIDGQEVQYDKLSIVYLQIFDVLTTRISIRQRREIEKDQNHPITKMKNAINELQLQLANQHEKSVG